LNKPFFNPPNWIFAPVWTILYFFIWYSFYKIWTSNKSSIKNESLIYYVHLLVNWLWSFIFFWLKNPWYALIDIIILWILIIIMIKMFYKTSKISSYLLCPYLAWVSFALILNMSIFLLN
jgi:tryptophan-rich sensory protein